MVRARATGTSRSPERVSAVPRLPRAVWEPMLSSGDHGRPELQLPPLARRTMPHLCSGAITMTPSADDASTWTRLWAGPPHIPHAPLNDSTRRHADLPATLLPAPVGIRRRERVLVRARRHGPHRGGLPVARDDVAGLGLGAADEVLGLRLEVAQPQEVVPANLLLLLTGGRGLRHPVGVGVGAALGRRTPGVGGCETACNHALTAGAGRAGRTRRPRLSITHLDWEPSGSQPAPIAPSGPLESAVIQRTDQGKRSPRWPDQPPNLIRGEAVIGTNTATPTAEKRSCCLACSTRRGRPSTSCRTDSSPPDTAGPPTPAGRLMKILGFSPASSVSSPGPGARGVPRPGTRPAPTPRSAVRPRG